MDKNIKLAIEQEKEYLRRKVDCGDNTANIYEYLAPSGYTNLAEFNEDKQEYLLKDEYYHIVNEPNIWEGICIPYMESHKSSFQYAINCDDNYAFVGADFGNDVYLEKNGFKVLRMSYDSPQGLILSSNGDLRVCIVINGSLEYRSSYFLHKMREFLSTKFVNVKCDGNDLLINNKKVCGTVEFDYNDMRAIMFQITFIDNTDIIKEICGDSEKEPGFIDSDVVTPEELKNEMLSWLIEH